MPVLWLLPNSKKAVSSALLRRLLRCLVVAAAFLPFGSADALDNRDAAGIPHVSDRARDSFLEYLYAPDHKAFAVAPGGAWSWVSGSSSEGTAREAAIRQCQSHTAQNCLLFALNDSLVFDRANWARLWRPYTNPEHAQSAPVGEQRGKRFFNLAFHDSDGNRKTIEDFRGKITLVHFWGSWCPPCMRELPSLQQLHLELDRRLPQQTAMVTLQVREPLATSQRWLRDNDLADLPVFDSGATDDNDQFTLADGKTMHDRKIAMTFPTSYVLDKSGVVIFSHRGPVADWREYLPFFEDAALHLHE